jgi:hypothetical protein
VLGQYGVRLVFEDIASVWRMGIVFSFWSAEFIEMVDLVLLDC